MPTAGFRLSSPSSRSGKNHEELQFRFPPQARPSQLWDGGLEGGDTGYLVARGYGHVVVDARGTGDGKETIAASWAPAEAETAGHSRRHRVDRAAALVRRHVGMVGISYLAATQALGAASSRRIKGHFPGKAATTICTKYATRTSSPVMDAAGLHGGARRRQRHRPEEAHVVHAANFVERRIRTAHPGRSPS